MKVIAGNDVGFHGSGIPGPGQVFREFLPAQLTALGSQQHDSALVPLRPVPAIGTFEIPGSKSFDGSYRIPGW
jgi:hypothetical protein